MGGSGGSHVLGPPFNKHILYSHPWQFLQSLGWTVCLELGHSFQKPLTEEAENFLCSKLRQASKLGPPKGGLKPQEQNCRRKHTPSRKTGRAKGSISYQGSGQARKPFSFIPPNIHVTTFHFKRKTSLKQTASKQPKNHVISDSHFPVDFLVLHK